MLGLVFTEFVEMVEDHFSAETADAMLSSGLGRELVFDHLDEFGEYEAQHCVFSLRCGRCKRRFAA